jgi:phage terminase large subunit GpA-like protein
MKGSGEFRCPKCGAEVSPDDETENVYVVLETVMKGDCLERIILQCNKCGAQIHLIGFHFLPTRKDGNASRRKNSTPA